MHARTISPPVAPSRARVGIVRYTESLPVSFIEGLEREVICVEELDVQAGRTRKLDVDVVLLWLAPKASTKVLAQVSGCLGGNRNRIGVLGCAPNGDMDDTIAFLEAGADDFVAGRCGVRELASRIHALRQRISKKTPVAEHQCRSLKLDVVSHEVLHNRRTIRLSPTEVSVLKVLVDGRGRALSRSQILDRAWGDAHFDLGERAVDNVILRLRRKLGTPKLIETVRGVGFRFADQH